ncbi:DDE-type integrase/transposase/recombinase [Candidatus Woesearchaeota archaeon]|nr:DDE-type integrase/transposase/recombinase [Candidatus Woesearchaeota archaeon]
MKKLTRKKIRWIVLRMKEGRMSVYRIAKQQHITQRWVRELYRRYLETGKYPFPRKPGRKPKEISVEERKTVLDLRQEHPLCAGMLERILAERGIKFAHNRIHKILSEEGIVKKQPNKSRRRKWIRYQRRHSNSLWHTDWFTPKHGKHLNIMEDDASRFIPGYGEFKRETSKNAADVFKNTVQNHGIPRQLMSDHGTTFVSLPREGCPEPQPNIFQMTVEKAGTEHIKARVKHPQSNGKVERVYLTLYRLKEHFGTWDATFEYYNYRRPHMSLSHKRLRTPYQAYLDKNKGKTKIGGQTS